MGEQQVFPGHSLEFTGNQKQRGLEHPGRQLVPSIMWVSSRLTTSYLLGYLGRKKKKTSISNIEITGTLLYFLEEWKMLKSHWKMVCRFLKCLNTVIVQCSNPLLVCIHKTNENTYPYGNSYTNMHSIIVCNCYKVCQLMNNDVKHDICSQWNPM